MNIKELILGSFPRVETVEARWREGWGDLSFTDAASDGWPALLSTGERERLLRGRDAWLLERVWCNDELQSNPPTRLRSHSPYLSYPMPPTALPYVLRSAWQRVSEVRTMQQAGNPNEEAFEVCFHDGRVLRGLAADMESFPRRIQFNLLQVGNDVLLANELAHRVVAHVQSCQQDVWAYRDALTQDLGEPVRKKLGVQAAFEPSVGLRDAARTERARQWGHEDRQRSALQAAPLKGGLIRRLLTNPSRGTQLAQRPVGTTSVR